MCGIRGRPALFPPCLEDATVKSEVDLRLLADLDEVIAVAGLDRFNYIVDCVGTRIGVMVEFDGADEQVGKDVAMHIAAMKPVSLSSDQVPAELIEKERSIAAQKALESGKPAEIISKMVEGSVQKFLKEVSLFNQPFVKNDKQTVEQMLKAANTSVKSFAMYIVGEGIEKKQDDFAAEVAAQVAAAKQA